MAWIIKIKLDSEVAEKLGKLSDCKFYLLDSIQDSVMITLSPSRAKQFNTLEAAEEEVEIRKSWSVFPGFIAQASEFEILEVTKP